MFDWIPLSSYTAIFFNVLMLFMLIMIYHANENTLTSPDTRQFSKVAGLFCLLFVILYMGSRPVSGAVFGDMRTYANFYELVQTGSNPIVTKDFLFNYFLVACTKVMDKRTFFFLCASIYTLPCFVFSRKYGGSYWFFVFFIFVSSYMFWPYGTNGIRNGIGTSLFILALCFYQKKIIMYLIMALSVGIHNSLAIPIIAFLVSGVYKNPKIYLYVWLAAIPISLVSGSFWQTFFSNFGFGDDARAVDYLTKGNVNNDQFAYSGFRWDFLLYSSFAVFAGWYFIFKKKVMDNFYIHLWGTYMIANSFWILVISANFSNRFAYVSWFLMAPIVAYPILKFKIWHHQYRNLSVILALYYLFTYVMFLKG